MTFADDVRLELQEMKRLGVKVSDKALAMTEGENRIELEEYADDAMSVSDCASLLIELYN